MGSIRARLTAGFAAALMGTMILFVLALLIARKNDALTQLDDRVTQELDRTIEIIDKEWLRAPGSPIVTLSDETARPRYTPLDSAAFAANVKLKFLLELAPEYILIADPAGRLLYRSQKVRSLVRQDSERQVRGTVVSDSARMENVAKSMGPDTGVVLQLSHEQIFLRVRRLPSNGRVDRVWIGLSAEDARFAPTSLIAVMLIVAPMLLALSLSGAYFIAGRAFQPVDAIIDQVEAITDGRSLHRRLAVSESADELSRLSATLNAMIERLETSFGALRRFTADASHELKTPLTVIRADVERSMSPSSTASEK
ncbi:MAG: HAMP domain-containing histidine kinase, partial [Phycisphaerae bacterium]|nr:HAMP domain-containing histidine kinase [Gemmatimonadaceae bacterium]